MHACSWLTKCPFARLTVLRARLYTCGKDVIIIGRTAPNFIGIRGISAIVGAAFEIYRARGERDFPIGKVAKYVRCIKIEGVGVDVRYTLKIEFIIVLICAYIECVLAMFIG